MCIPSLNKIDLLLLIPPPPYPPYFLLTKDSQPPHPQLAMNCSVIIYCQHKILFVQVAVASQQIKMTKQGCSTSDSYLSNGKFIIFPV